MATRTIAAHTEPSTDPAARDRLPASRSLGSEVAELLFLALFLFALIWLVGLFLAP